MNLAAVLADAEALVSLANTAIQVGTDAAPFIKKAYAVLVQGATLTDAERAEMVTQETALTAMLDAETIPADAK